VYGLSIGNKSGDLARTLATFPGSHYFTTDISHTFCRSATKFGRIRGLTIRNLFREFRKFWSGDPVIPCGDMHQSFVMHL